MSIRNDCKFIFKSIFTGTDGRESKHWQLVRLTIVMGVWLFYQSAVIRVGFLKVGSYSPYQRTKEFRDSFGNHSKWHCSSWTTSSRKLLFTVFISKVRHLGSRHRHHFNLNQSGTLFAKAGVLLWIKSKWFMVWNCNPGRIIWVKAKGPKLIGWSSEAGNNLP